MSSNPYQTPAPVPLPSHRRFDIHQQLWALIVLMTQAVVVGIFVGALWWCIALYYAGQFYATGALSLLLGMFVFALAGDNWVQRVAYACSVPFFVGGAAAGVYLYLQAGVYSTLEAYVFSGGSGMAGLIFCLVAAGMLAGQLAYHFTYIGLRRLAE